MLISNEEGLGIINQLEKKSTGTQSIPLKLIPDLIPLSKIKIKIIFSQTEIISHFKTIKQPNNTITCKTSHRNKDTIK